MGVHHFLMSHRNIAICIFTCIFISMIALLLMKLSFHVFVCAFFSCTTLSSHGLHTYGTLQVPVENLTTSRAVG